MLIGNKVPFIGRRPNKLGTQTQIFIYLSNNDRRLYRLLAQTKCRGLLLVGQNIKLDLRAGTCVCVCVCVCVCYCAE